MYRLILGAFAKLGKVSIGFMSVRPSVRLHETTRFPPDGFPWNLIFEYISKICHENSSLFKIWQAYWVLYMKNNINFLSHLAHFLLEWEIFQIKVVENIKIHILCSATLYFRKSCRLWENVEIAYSREGHRWQFGAYALYSGYLRLQMHTQNM